ncbi:MAG TPA: sialidase family protein [Candidatus Thermoplasmatota archaeon]|nr:sialidase family protein [Candidatus Thermoplasmatota archaeon]
MDGARLAVAVGLVALLASPGCIDNGPPEPAKPGTEHGLPAAGTFVDRPLLDERVRAREIDVATDPNEPLHMVAVMMVPYPAQYALAPMDSMQWTGLALSGDGGRTWDYEPIRGYPGDSVAGPFPGAWALGDAVVNFQPDGSVLIGLLPIRLPVIISIGVVEYPWGSREPTFSSEFATGALGVDGMHDVPTSQVGPHVDKEQVTIDPATGDVYITYSERWQQSSEARIMFAKGTDGGRTWTDPVAVDPPQPHYIGSGKHQLGAWPVIAADGRLLVLWSELRSGSLYVSEVLERGEGGFSEPRLIDQAAGLWIPSVGVDRTGGPNDGTLYAVVADDRNGDTDAFLHVSRDNGTTWDPAVRVNQDAVGNGMDLRMPELVVEPDGSVSIVYMQAVDGPTTVHAFVARSTDGGRTFTETRVSSEPTDPVAINNQPSFLTHLGDYLGISYNDDGVVAVWQDGRKSTSEVPYSEAWVAVLPTRIDGP